MRTIMLAATLALSSLVPAPTAEACGGYGAIDRAPRLFTLSTMHDGAAFVLLHANVDADKARWRALSPYSYDRTEVADAPPFGQPLTFTLIGPAGTKTVTTTRRVLIRDAWNDFATPMSAAVLPDLDAGYVVALIGSRPDLAWHELSDAKTTATARSHATRLGFAPNVSRQRFDRDVELLTGFEQPATTSRPRLSPRTIVRVANTDRGIRDGRAIGVVADAGARYAVIRDRNVVTVVAI